MTVEDKVKLLLGDIMLQNVMLQNTIDQMVEASKTAKKK